ncbi:OmpA family protein [Candidatus Berkiella cookevillensis]|uniref:OmpA family protein n=1 Tax=Candidatus Berkiella cookevillensis TaxID=437022 RepID=A0A0Q9YN01_9GAMM|nr:OmpA family protein [Candidatus Berkiella cookevillensis]MCS5708781.1 OmpA family protein [Candidatus Berkiella cookevillensis]
MSNGTLVKAAIVALSCSFALVGCGTYNHNYQASFDHNHTNQVAFVNANVDAETLAVNKASDEAKNAQENQDKNQQHIVSSTYHFKHDSAALNEHAKTELDQFAQYLAKNPSAKINVEGYTDPKGKAEYNLALGMRRAEAVAEYLRTQGVKESQIKVKSYGEEKLVNTKSSPDALAQNRRAVVSFETDEGIA